MDFDKMAAFITKIGLVPATLAWLAWELHNFVQGVMDTQKVMATLLQKLIEMHTR